MTDPTVPQTNPAEMDAPIPAAVAEDKTVISAPEKAREREELFRSVTMAEVARVLEGKTLDHFSLEKLIGGGGMGAVFRGRDTRLNRTVAIKVVPSQRRDAEALRRFRAEAQAAARLDHPNIARVYYIGEADDWNYIVFEYIDGINVRELVTREGPLSVDDAVFYTRQVTEALQHAFERDVVHRDIKPSNLLVSTGGQLKLVDMGLARSTSQDRSSADLTASGVTLGTFDYISPEQARDPRDADVRSDLYSLGCTLYFMLTGEPPFPDGTALQKLLSHGSQPPPDPRRVRSDLGDELIAIMMKLMAKRPTDRYQKPVELIGDLILLADLEQLPKSRLPGSLTVTPTIAQRSLLETHLPWIFAAMLLLFSVLWMQNAETWSASYPLPQPRIMMADESLEAPTVTPSSLKPSAKESTLEENSDFSEQSTSATTSEKRLDGSPANPSLPMSEAKLDSRDGALTPMPADSSSGLALSPPSLSSPDVASLSGIGSTKPTAEKPFKMVDDRYGPEPRRDSRSGSVDNNMSPASPPPIAASPATPADVDSKLIDSLIISDEPLASVAPNQLRKGSLQEAILAAKDNPRIARIQLATNLVRLSPIQIPRSGLVIEAAPGYAPILAATVSSSTSSMPGTDNSAAASIEVGGHEVTWKGIEFRLSAQDGMQRGAIWKVNPHAVLNLEQCIVTLDDPSQRSLLTAIVVDSDNTAGTPSVNDSPEAENASVVNSNLGVSRELDPLQIRAEDIIVRGEGDWLSMPVSHRAEFRFDNGLIALSGKLLLLGGTVRKDSRPLTIRLFMDRVTCFARSGLAVIDSSSSSQYPICLVRQAVACSFAVGSNASLVRFLLGENPPAMADILQFRGNDNAYDISVETVCEVLSGGRAAQQFSLGNATSDWFQDRSLETSIRWVSVGSPTTALSKQTPENYLQRGTMFIPGFQVSRLPRLSSSSAAAPPTPTPPPSGNTP
jgi:serine/threonine protein kinase